MFVVGEVEVVDFVEIDEYVHDFCEFEYIDFAGDGVEDVLSYFKVDVGGFSLDDEGVEEEAEL